MASFRGRCFNEYGRYPAERASISGYAAVFFAIAFAGQRRFQTGFLSGRNIEGMPFDFADDVFLLHFTLESAERALQRFVIAEFNFCHLTFHLPFDECDWNSHRVFAASFLLTESAIWDRWDAMRATARVKRTATLAFTPRTVKRARSGGAFKFRRQRVNLKCYESFRDRFGRA